VKPAETLRRACLAEFVGTFILVFFGTGVVHTAVLTGAQAGLGQVAVVWAVGVALAVYATGAISGAHLNPAMTLAFAAFRGFPRRRIAPYVLAQLAGAFCAAVVLYALFHGVLEHFERAHGLVRGCPRSVLSAMVYGEYFPNPALAAAGLLADADVSLWQAMLGEAVGTAFLALFVFALTERPNTAGPSAALVPLCIGLAVALNISIVAPLTQAGFNPARDFGPRLFAWLAGWGEIAIPGPRGGWFTVYILAPCLGALAGAGLYHALLAKTRSTLPESTVPPCHEGDAAP
jgi:glycerol uptake facilitator protein